MNTNSLQEVALKLAQARSSRKKGDALRTGNRNEPARAAYEVGVHALNEALQLLDPNDDEIAVLELPLNQDQARVVDELVELYGTLGGMYQRLERNPEASDAYAHGAALEERFSLPSTYNRLNAVKCTLMTGKQRLREMEPRIGAIAVFIQNQLSSTAAADSGWAWADLGDCLALLNDVEGARKAYAAFISKAEIKSPARTLEVLKKIAEQLRQFNDPDVGRLESAIEVLESQLTS